MMGFDKTWTIKWTSTTDDNITVESPYHAICDTDNFIKYKGYGSTETAPMVGQSEHRTSNPG